MRISDWSSDVCSSDLEPQCLRIGEAKRAKEMIEVLADRERRRGEQPGPRIGFAHALEIDGNFDRRCVEAAAAYQRFDTAYFLDRQSVVLGKRVAVRLDPRGRCISKTKKKTHYKYVSKPY